MATQLAIFGDVIYAAGISTGGIYAHHIALI
jgi:hypothetical protein